MTVSRGLAVLAAMGALATPALAQVEDDRPPTSAEREAIERVLRAEGFVTWDDIELDDGVWEVDDARTGDGREYDLELRPETYEIIRRDPDT